MVIQLSISYFAPIFTILMHSERDSKLAIEQCRDYLNIYEQILMNFWNAEKGPRTKCLVFGGDLGTIRVQELLKSTHDGCIKSVVFARW